MFKIGDKVKIIKKPDNTSMSPGWVEPEMDRTLGKTGIVTNISGMGNIFIQEFGWWYHPTWLAPVSGQLVFDWAE